MVDRLWRRSAGQLRRCQPLHERDGLVRPHDEEVLVETLMSCARTSTDDFAVENAIQTYDGFEPREQGGLMASWKRFVVLFGTFVLGQGCMRSETVDDTLDVPVSEDDSLGEQQTISDNGWMLSATRPQLSPCGDVTGGALVSGPSGATRALGVCLLIRTTTACTTVADCNSAPSTLPSGGYRYCVAPNGAGTKYCSYRPGSQAGWCAGTPALGTPMGAVNLSVVAVSPGGIPADRWLSYACFAGCTASDPSSSSLGGTSTACF
jgi:hypothetical protein